MIEIIDNFKQTCVKCGNCQFIRTHYGKTCVECGTITNNRLYPEKDFTRTGISAINVENFRNYTSTLSKYAKKDKRYQKLIHACQHSIPYSLKKRSRAYHEMKHIVFGLQLPLTLLDEGVYIYDKLVSEVKAGTGLANVELLATAATFFAALIRNVYLTRKELVDITGISLNSFNQGLLRYNEIIHRYPRLSRAIHEGRHKLYLQKAAGILVQFLGKKPCLTGQITQIFRKIRPALIGMTGKTCIGVLVYFSLQILSIKRNVTISEISKKVGYAPSSLYNAISTVCKKMGIPMK